MPSSDFYTKLLAAGDWASLNESEKLSVLRDAVVDLLEHEAEAGQIPGEVTQRELARAWSAHGTQSLDPSDVSIQDPP